jgi:hypothetical protein
MNRRLIVRLQPMNPDLLGNPNPPIDQSADRFLNPINNSMLPPIMASIYCSYRNTTDRMVIVRCCGPSDFYLERVVFPFELLSFQCPHESDVQVWSHGSRGAELAETLDAKSLRMPESSGRRRPDWLPETSSRAVGVRGNASAVCLDQI